jgi:hypothetical protein
METKVVVGRKSIPVQKLEPRQTLLGAARVRKDDIYCKPGLLISTPRVQTAH